MSYKKDTTLNEKDSLTDMLLLEKALVKAYGTAITEGCSKEYMGTVKNNFIEQVSDQHKIFTEMQKNGYYEITYAEQSEIDKQKQNFEKMGKSLS